jgi:hypothetical protein
MMIMIKYLFKSVALTTTAVLAISFSSLQKTFVSNKVKSEVNASGSGEKFLYSYDSLGRLLVFENEKQNTKRIYDYSLHDSIIIIQMDNKTRQHRQAWLIDTNGYLYKGSNVVHTYNQYGFLVESDYTFKSHSSKEVFSISNEDVTKREVLDDGKVTAATEWTYYPTKDNRDYGQAFRGRRSEHLKKTESELYKDSTILTTYTYTFDNLGRVNTQTISSPKGNNTWKYSYTN